MPRKTKEYKDLKRGKRVEKVFEDLFPGMSMSAIAKELEVASEAQIRRFKNGYQIEMQALVELGKRGVSLMYLLSGEDSVPPSNAARAREPVNFVLNAKAIPVVGEAAADETQGQKAGFLPQDPETRYDELHFPETTAAVRIIGDSMAPVLLGGQYALIGPEYLGKFDNPKSHEIVVADVEIRDDDQASSDARWTGTYCKRIVDGGDVWVFLSIAPTGVPFTVSKANCRLWPVIGVWFAGKGEPPED